MEISELNSILGEHGSVNLIDINNDSISIEVDISSKDFEDVSTEISKAIIDKLRPLIGSRKVTVSFTFELPVFIETDCGKIPKP